MNEGELRMIGKIIFAARCLFDGLLITLGALLIAGDKRDGGTEINGYIALVIWALMIGIMYKVSNLLGVAGIYAVYFVIYIVRYGLSQGIVFCILALVAICILVYKLEFSR